MAASNASIRRVSAADFDALAELRHALWPEASRQEHYTALRSRATERSIFPTVLLVAHEGERLLGFVEVGMRSYADGCDDRQPCAFIEGWYVAPAYRRQAIGRALIVEAEAWALEQGCIELASNSLLRNTVARRAHEAVGFEVVETSVSYRKPLVAGGGGPSETEAPRAQTSCYGRDLARVHHEHFGMVAEAAMRVMKKALAAAGITRGRVVELASGSGLSARQLGEAGLDVVGFDISPDMLRIAREHAPKATFVLQSLWTAELPSCVAVTAIGEPFNYVTEGNVPSLAALGGRIEAIAEALVPGGILLFDVAGLGRSGPAGARQFGWSRGDAFLWLDEREDRQTGRLTRRIEAFVSAAGLYRRSQEVHELQLFEPDALEDLLAAAGFAVDRLRGYDGLELPGWTCFVAIKR